MNCQETYRAAFDEPPAAVVYSNVDPKTLVSPSISYGLGYAEACSKHVRNTFGSSRVYIICSGTLSRETDRLERLIERLEKDGVKVVGTYKGIRPHTPWSQIMEITNEARNAKVDCIVTLGAGSITDGAKIVVLALANGLTEPLQLGPYSVEAAKPMENVKPPQVPLICIATSLSGGEYFSLAGGTDDIISKHKQGILQPGMGVRLLILDPSLCLGTPWYHWLSTGMRSVDHCIEALCSLESTATSDKDAEEGLNLLIPWLLKTKADESNVEAVHKCQMGVLLAMKSIRAGIPMGGSHAIGHQLGPLGVGHGITSCILCPAVMKWNIANGGGLPQIKAKQEKVLGILWAIDAGREIFEDAGLKHESADLGDLLDAFIRKLGLPRTLKEVGIGHDQLDALSERALEDFWAPTNPIPLLEAAKVKEILNMVVE